MQRHVLHISQQGQMATISGGPLMTLLIPLGQVSTRRASHVEPVYRVKRAAFRLLRWPFGDTGRVADWPRNWRGPWQADLAPSGGPVLGPFRNRQNAIDAEVAWLNEHIFNIHNWKETA